MPKGVNKVILVGFLGQDPDVKTSQGGMVVTTLNLATNRKVKDGENWVEQADWHRVVCFDKLAEICRDYLKKGSQVYIEGRLQTRKWQDQQGQDRWTTEVVASEMQMLGSKGNGGENGGNGGSYQPPPVPQTYQQRPPPSGPPTQSQQYDRQSLPPPAPPQQPNYQQPSANHQVSHQSQGNRFDDDIPF